MRVKRAVLLLIAVIATGMLYVWASLERQEAVLLAGTLWDGTQELAIEATEKEIRLSSSGGKPVASYKLQSGQEHIISCCAGDIDKDSKDELLIITGTADTFYGDRLLILSYDGTFEIRYDRSYEQLNPWKVQLADVDGDGTAEISIGVYKESPFHPVMAKRPYLYYWHNGDLVPKWRGSRLSRPFEDYMFSDMDDDGMAELVALENMSSGKKVVCAYNWKGFGFESIAESKPYEDILKIEKQCDEEKSIRARVKEDGKAGWVDLMLDGSVLR